MTILLFPVSKIAATEAFTSSKVHIPVERKIGKSFFPIYFKRGIFTASSAPILNAPTANVAQTTDLNEDGTVKQQAPIIKAYVVESEMTDAQKSVRNIQRNATIS